jgi:hypothetical protein
MVALPFRFLPPDLIGETCEAPDLTDLWSTLRVDCDPINETARNRGDRNAGGEAVCHHAVTDVYLMRPEKETGLPSTRSSTFDQRC